MKNSSSKKALIFYFLTILLFLLFGNCLRELSYSSYLKAYTNSLFSITYTTNTGSAFGLFANNSYILAAFAFFALIFLAYYVYKNITFNDKLELYSITVFSAGALGNLIERLRFGYVIDYINLNFINFPVFNAFDIMICSGVLLYFIFVLLDLRKENGNKN